MDKNISLDEFLIRNRIDNDTWVKANIEWPLLQAIARDHEVASANLEDTAQLFAKVIQKFKGVHSVRWRVKDSEHLIAKIVRKRSECNPKYQDITQLNYFDCVTDLIGVSALHLFKENCFEIDTALKSQWNPVEKPIAYIREGDSENLKSRFSTEGFEVKNHPAGYRSVHYVIESTPLKRKIFSEIQVRTIFEEGWSEIDHKIRYPNFTDNELVEYFLEIFNRMAGSADDMGGFVLGLVATFSQMEDEISVIKKEKMDAFQDVELALSQLESVKKQDNASKESIATLKAEVAKLKAIQASQGIGMFNSTAAEQASRGIFTNRLSELASGTALHGLGMFSAPAAEQVRRSLGMVSSPVVERASRNLIIDLNDSPKPNRAEKVNSNDLKIKE
jgi:ppGpp synthetase/RelA/SpoT-type nucleotidyltranferase